MNTNPTTQSPSENAAFSPPREGTKQAKLVSLLSRKSGVTLEKAAEALGWQKHTTSATMTGLRKRGYVIDREPHDGKPSVYRIKVEA